MLSPFGWARLRFKRMSLLMVTREYGWDVHGLGAGLREVNKKNKTKIPPP